MPYSPHIKVVINGIFGTGAVPREIWSTSFTMANIATHTADATDLPDFAAVESYAGSIGAAWAADSSRMPSNTLLKSVKISLIDADGHVAVAPSGAYYQQEHVYAPAVTGPIAQPQYPYQVAWVMSLLTAAAGRHGKGRMYLPAMSILDAIQSDGLMNVDQRASMMTLGGFLLSEATATFDATASSVVGNPLNLGVHVAGSDGVNRRLTFIKGGRVYDTQRRRRNALNEDYVAVNIGA